MINISKKLIFTLKTLRGTVNHQYGYRPISYLKFIYYGIFRVNTFIVFENYLTRELTPHNLDPEFEVIKPSLDKLSELIKGKDLPREFYCDKICNVKTCYLVLRGSEIASIHWVFFKNDDSRFLILSDGVAEFNYITTIHKFRGHHLCANTVSYISKDLQSLGYKKVIGVIHEQNIAMIKCILQAGFREVGKIKSLGPFHRKLKV